MKIQLEPLLKELCRLSEAQAALGSPRPPAFPPELVHKVVQYITQQRAVSARRTTPSA